MRSLSQCLAILGLALVAGVGDPAAAATLALVSAPGAELDVLLVSKGSSNASVDLSSRLRGSLTAEPLGAYQGIRFSLTGDGAPIQISTLVPGYVGLPMTIQLDQVTWTTPDPAALPSLAPAVGTGALVPFPSFVAHFVGSVDVDGYVTPFDLLVNELTPPASVATATTLPVFVPTADSIVIGGSSGNTAGPSFVAHGSWYPGNHVDVTVYATLFTHGLLFVPEPGLLTLVTAALAGLTLARRSRAA
jgi:hypothetical protein